MDSSIRDHTIKENTSNDAQFCEVLGVNTPWSVPKHFG